MRGLGVGASRVVGGLALFTMLAIVGPLSLRGEEPTNDAAPTLSSEFASTTPKVFEGGIPKSVSELKAMQSHLQRITDQLVAATVGVRVGSAYGSGVIVSRDGTILTAAHVAQEPLIACDIILADGRVVRGKTLGLNRNLDAALIQIVDEGPWPTAPMAKSDDVSVGQWCVATGHPGGYEKGRKPVVRLGRLLEETNSVLVTDCTLVGGDSGGPLFDAEGHVIGIHSRIGGMLAANLHIPVGAFRRSWERMEKGEAWGHLPGQAPFLGVRGAPDEGEARISEVFPDTPASRAGLKVGDVVTRFQGEAVADFSSLTDKVSKLNPGTSVIVVVRRDEQLLELKLVIGKR